MANHDDESFLPRITVWDIAEALYEDITEPTHTARLERLTKHNPELIHEVIRRAYVQAHDTLRQPGNPIDSTLDIQKVIIDSVTFVLSALEASLRHKNERFTDDAYGEDQPRSDEPGDDPLAE